VIVVEVQERGGELRRTQIVGAETTIGRHSSNDIVLQRVNVSKRHARIVRRDDGSIAVVDLKSTNGTFVNGRKITGPVPISRDDTIYIGDFWLRAYDDLEPPPLPYFARDPVEHRLLTEIAERDEAARVVYADWLEDRGELERAEFLRTQQEIAMGPPDGARLEHLAGRLRVLAASIDIPWRMRVARSPVERCGVTFELQCPKDWGKLEPTDREDVRYCGSCKKTVHYALTVEDARHHARRGNCVALDIGGARWAQDLEPPYGRFVCRRCNLDVGPSLDACPRCGIPIARMTATVGIVASPR